MKHLTLFLLAVATMAGFVALIVPARGHAAGDPAPAFLTEIPHGYRDWRWISSAHEAGNLNSLGAVLGNDVAIKAYRDGKFPYPDGTIIAALHYRHVPSDENNKVFGQAQSFVPGAPTNVQFMIKDSKKYAATGGCDITTVYNNDTRGVGGGGWGGTTHVSGICPFIHRWGRNLIPPATTAPSHSPPASALHPNSPARGPRRLHTHSHTA